MIISHKHQFIFVKTRKTAGSTLEKLLFPFLGETDICTGSPRDNTPRINTSITNGHMSWRKIQVSFPKEWDTYYKFTIERNPWDKVVSSYFWHKLIKEERFGTMSFEEYVMTCDLLPVDWSIYGDQTGVKVDTVYRYEDLPQMYEELNNKYGFDISRETLMETRLKSGIRKVADYRDMHTEATQNKVANLFKQEIAFMRYNYDNIAQT